MALYDYSTQTGLTIPDTLDVREAISEKFKSAFGANVDTSEETHIGRFIDEVTEMVVQSTGVNAQNANQFNPRYATGAYLDNIGAAHTGPGLDLSRIQAKHSEVVITLSSSASGLVVPAGTKFETSDGFAFQLKSAVTCSTAYGSVYTGSGTAEAVESGAIYVLANTTWKVATPVTGLVGVANAAEQSEIGQDLETDESYRTRLLAALKGKNSDCAAIRDALCALTDSDGNQLLSSVRVYENGWPYPVDFYGVTLAPHSIFVCVQGGAGRESDIAWAILKNKSAGCGYTLTTKVAPDITSESAYRKRMTISDVTTLNISQVVTFFRPIERGIKITVTVDKTSYTGTSLVSDIKNAIKAHLADEGIGAEVEPIEFMAAINESMGGTVDIKSVALWYGGADVAEGESVTLTPCECFSTTFGSASAGNLEIVVQ